jgi:hypothetical protein
LRSASSPGIVRPNQNGRIDYRPKRRILWDYQKNTWAVVSFVQERREVTWHCTLVVTDQYPAFRGSAAQYAHVVQTIKLGALRGLEIYARLLAKRRGHNELVKVVVGLIADAH